MKDLLYEVAKFDLCLDHLSIKPLPISPSSKMKLQWDEKRAENLQNWIEINNMQLYDSKGTPIISIFFYYLGHGKSGDLPPKQECTTQWHSLIVDKLKNTKLTLLIGNYTQSYYLANKKKETLIETVRNFRKHIPNMDRIPPLLQKNNISQRKNSWFKV